MPKRMVDFDAAWRSEKLAALGRSPYAQFEPYYYKLLGIAQADGAFEWIPELIHRDVFQFSAPLFSLADTHALLRQLLRFHLVFRWKENGHWYGYFTGMEKPGRLPKASEIALKRYRVLGKQPPEGALSAFLARPYPDDEWLSREEVFLNQRRHGKSRGDSIAQRSQRSGDSIALGLGRGKDRKGLGWGTPGKGGEAGTVSPASSSLSPSSSSSLRSSSSSGSASSDAGDSGSPAKKKSEAVNKKKHPKFARELEKLKA